MITFICGLVFLIVGGALYGRLTEKVMKPTDADTPAVSMRDNVDFLPMKKWRNSLIELLNIAGTGPIIGPLQGILFGPIAFITIPIGCVIGGAFHDYMVGMISVRHGGEQTPSLIRKFLGKYMYVIYNVFVCLLLLLVGVVFIYTPGDLFVTHILSDESTISNPVVWIVYGAIFLYCIIATLFPIDKIIGKIYPIFGAILLLSAAGVLVGLFVKGYPMVEIWDASTAVYPYQHNFIPIFFVTVACGITSGFHATQATLVSRTISDEHDGRTTFYDMMIAEGIIAMIWAAAGMGALQSGLTNPDTILSSTPSVIGVIAKDMLGPVGGIIAIVGIIVLPITSADTSFRSLRLVLADAIHSDQTRKRNALVIALGIFVVAAALLVWAKASPAGFNLLWRYSFWVNETIAVFAFTMIAIYMKNKSMPYIMALVPGTFYMYVICSYILNAKIGFNLPWIASYIVAGVLTCAYAVLIMIYKKRKI